MFGLQTLLDDTYMVIPEVVEGALTAAQMLDMSRKKKAVASIINQAVVVAAGVGATPIPFADAAILVPNQVTMIARITAAYGLPPNRSKALAVAGSGCASGSTTVAPFSVAPGVIFSQALTHSALAVSRSLTVASRSAPT